MKIDNPHIKGLLSDEKVQQLLNEQEKTYWKSALGNTRNIKSSTPTSLSKLTFILTSYSLENPTEQDDVVELSYKLLKTFPISDDTQRREFNDFLNINVGDEYLPYYFLTASVALRLEKTISARLVLSEYDERDIATSQWGKRVLSSILQALLFLIRKQNGYGDIRKAIDAITVLQSEQKTFESDYLNSFAANQQAEEAIWLLALYHTSKAVVETAQYILKGYIYPNRRIETLVRQHMDMAKKLTAIASEKRLLYTIESDLYALIEHCIWTDTAISEKVKELCKYKGKTGILELLPSQRDAISKNLFDVAANAIVLQMPTSAGKTLLAEFNIVVTKSLLPNSKVVYIVPSRALVNQVYHDLKTDLSQLGYSVEKTSSVNEIDPSEDTFLQSEDVDILISTPEKLDLLIRRNHPSMQDVAMFIVDEAHTIRNGARGARLELLIAILRRERPNAKYMLLSPFLPGDKSSLQDWLGGGNTIEVNWKPSEKIVLGIDVTKKKVKTELIPSPYVASYKQQSIEEPIDVTLSSTGTKNRILEYSCKHFSETGKTQLVLCQGRTSANETAKKIFDWTDTPNSISEDVQLVQKYMTEEIGCSSLFSQLLSKRIAVHHAGLSDETKLLIEHLIREKQIQHVCATTTVAEGVNFPVSSVYFDSYYRGRSDKKNVLSSNDFWNIAGRAGRTMVDDFGKIILPFNSKENEELGLSIVNKSTEEIASVLAKLFDDRQSIMATLNTDENALFRLSHDYEDSFAPLFQYFIHLLHISKNEYVQDVEDLFKDTFIYSKLSLSEQTDFIDLCKKIYLTIEAKYSSATGLLSFADKTGFSVPSVLRIMNEQSKRSSIADTDSWKPENLFNRNNYSNLSEKIDVIATLPETGLGTDAHQAPFNPDIVAKVLIAWVNGDKLNNISTLHPTFNNNDDDTKRLTDFVTYINGARFKASWGLSALEGIVKGVESEVKDSYVPSYVYYGVNDTKSLALRMIGIPRSLSPSLSQAITNDVSTYSFAKLRKTINDLSLRDWDNLAPTSSQLSGEEWKRVVSILMEGN